MEKSGIAKDVTEVCFPLSLFYVHQIVYLSSVLLVIAKSFC